MRNNQIMLIGTIKNEPQATYELDAHNQPEIYIDLECDIYPDEDSKDYYPEVYQVRFERRNAEVINQYIKQGSEMLVRGWLQMPIIQGTDFEMQGKIKQR